MITVAIIGVLGAIAIPGYQRQISKARQAEAKITLISAYTFERNFYLQGKPGASSSANSYTLCLSQIGFLPPEGQRFYAVGFNVSKLTSLDRCSSSGDQSCLSATWNPVETCENEPKQTFFLANSNVGPNSPVVINNKGLLERTFPTPKISNTEFLLHAVGSISDGTQYDIWQVDHLKNVSHTGSGI